MKPFVFNLQTVLDVRRIREEQARADLAALCYREKQEEERIARLRQQRQDVQRRLVDGDAALSGSEVLAVASTERSLDLAIHDSQRQKEEITRQREIKLEQTRTVISQRKTVEVLREKAWGRHLYEAAVAAERQVDELCSRRAEERGG
ncbi:MAG TPA: hypothetical protein GX715_16765 [Armatimonadetes bacterium]|nr:hypothetical protein [Armatimonadota bacterium]